ncbi:MAG: glycosyltransferase, partial [Rhodospirillales bacterium]|nr:glycosyltransferase [Rhodospirillales bacterium]
MAADRVTDDPATETPDAPALSVVVPVFNEAENLRPLVADIRGALDGKLDYEIVYVDDGSTDDTPE